MDEIVEEGRVDGMSPSDILGVMKSCHLGGVKEFLKGVDLGFGEGGGGGEEREGEVIITRQMLEDSLRKFQKFAAATAAATATARMKKVNLQSLK